MLSYDQSDAFSRKMIKKRIEYSEESASSSSHLSNSESDKPLSNDNSGFEGGSDDGMRPSITAPKAGGNFDF